MLCLLILSAIIAISYCADISKYIKCHYCSTIKKSMKIREKENNFYIIPTHCLSSYDAK